jgi:hypothetical protein
MLTYYREYSKFKIKELPAVCRSTLCEQHILLHRRIMLMDFIQEAYNEFGKNV